MKSSRLLVLNHYRKHPLELGGPAWRRARGLMSISDLANDYRRSHYCRADGLFAALPTDRIGREVRSWL